MTIEAIAASAAVAPPTQVDTVQAGPGAGIGDVTSFQGALSAAARTGASAIGGPDSLSPAIKAMFTQLEKVNGEARSVADYAAQAQASGMEMTPAEVVQLTMRCHEFMFHCQLSSNIANRTSDGLQQLFRQQS